MYQVADADTPLPTLVGPGNFCVAIRNPAVAVAIADELNRLAAEVERLREERRWIPVGDRLPPLRGYYLIAWHNMRVTTAFWHGNEWDTLARDRITHWMPLPAPPAKEE